MSVTLTCEVTCSMHPSQKSFACQLPYIGELLHWQVRLEDPAKYQSIVDAEWNIIYDKLAKCRSSGAKIVLSRLAIGDLATQYFADHDIFCAGRVRRPALLTHHLCPCYCCSARNILADDRVESLRVVDASRCCALNTTGGVWQRCYHAVPRNAARPCRAL